MIAETTAAVALTLAGAGLLVGWRRDVPSAALVWLAFPTGAAAYLFVALALLITVGSVGPWIAVAGVGAAGVVGTVFAGRDGRLLASLPAVLLACVWVVAVAVAAWFIPLARLTIDSGEYLLGAAQIQSDGAVDLMAPYLLKRQVGMQALHAFSSSAARAHVAWVSPLFGFASVGLASWFLWSKLSGNRRLRLSLIVGFVAFLASSSRFLYDFFYVHPHIQMAAYLFIAVVGAWLAVTESAPAWAMASGFALGALLLFRPESPVLVAVVLGVVAASPADRAVRRLVALPPLVTVALWYGAILWRSAPEGGAVGLTDPIFSSLIAVVGAAAVVLVLGGPGMDRWRLLLGRSLVPVVLGVLVVYTVSDPLILRDSIVATFRNQKRLGWWVTTWAVAVPLTGVALAVARFRLADLWSRVVIAFGVLFFVFPYLRGSPWRVGPGDSGNRMLAHFLLIVMVFVFMALSPEDDQGERAT